MKNARTTIAGICTIAGGILAFAGAWLHSGQVPSSEVWVALGVALSTGGGLIAAADGKPQEPPK
jgi:hypothetical protein